MAPSILELREQPQIWSTQPIWGSSPCPCDGSSAPRTGEGAAIHLFVLS